MKATPFKIEAGAAIRPGPTLQITGHQLLLPFPLESNSFCGKNP